MPARKTTAEQEKELVRRYMEGAATAELVSDYGVSDTGVRNILRRHGVTPSHGQQPLAEEQRRWAFALLNEGLDLRDIAARVGCTDGVLSKIFRRDFGVEKRPSVKRPLLSPEQRAEVVRRYKEYATYEELTKEYDCSPSVIKSALIEHGLKPRVGWAKYRTVDWTDRKGRQLRFKSSWELAFAQKLDAEGMDWNYEPRAYPLKVCRQYTPDFEVLGECGRLVEIHGWMDRRTEDRFEEFRRTYPELLWELLGPAELASMGVVDRHWTTHPQAGKVTRAALRLRDLVLKQKTS